MKVSHSEPRAAERCERPSSLALLAPHPEPGATQGITPDVEPEILYPAQGDDVSIASESEFLVKEAPKDQLVMAAHRRAGGHDARSPDSACYANSPAFSPRRRLDDSSLICDGNSSEDDDEEPTRSTHSDLSPVTPDHDRYHKYFGDSGADTPLSAETSSSRGPPRSGGETTMAAAAAGVGTPRHSITTKFRNNVRSSPSRSSPSSPANSITTTTLPQKDKAPARKPVEFPVKSRPGERRTSGVVDRAATPRGPQAPAASSRSPAASGAADRRRTPGLPGSGRPSDGTPTSSAMRKAASMYDLAQEELVVNAENCEEAANDLLQSLQKAILLYHKIQSSETPVGSKHLASVLADAFDGARAQLSTLDRSEANASGGGRSNDANDDVSCARGVDGDGDGPLLPDDASSSPGEDKTSALLEHYSNMLMSMLEKKMSGNKL